MSFLTPILLGVIAGEILQKVIEKDQQGLVEMGDKSLTAGIKFGVKAFLITAVAVAALTALACLIFSPGSVIVFPVLALKIGIGLASLVGTVVANILSKKCCQKEKQI